MLADFDYSFSENGLVAYKDGVSIGRTSINDHLGEENMKVQSGLTPVDGGSTRVFVRGWPCNGLRCACMHAAHTQAIVNWTLRYLSELDIPIKR